MREEPITSFGEFVRSLRVKKRLSLREVAQIIGIDTSLLGKIERNQRHPTKAQIKHVAKFFELDEKQMIKELLSDQFAFRIIKEQVDLDTLKVAEKKVEYLKRQKWKS
jgi:transcriptional regulator with XRE-family HTH domain